MSFTGYHRFTATLVFLVFLAATKPVFAATINVPADQPTIQAAVNAASSGDVIRVAPGDYSGSVQFQGKDLRLESTDGPQVTTIRGSGGTAIDIGPGAAVIGFTVTGGEASFGGGMAVQGAGTLIRGNIFERNVQSYGGFGAAIAMNNGSPVIERNVFRYNSAQGDTQFLAGAVALVNSSSPRIINNLFYDNECRALNITVPAGNRPEVLNNTIVRNPVGIYVDARVSTATHTYRNNLIVGNGIGLEVVFQSDSGNEPTWEHNLVYGNGTNYVGISNLTGVDGNISADPGFAYQTTNDFGLPQSSLAIDAGSNVDAPSEDYAGTARPLDGDGDGTALADIGAVEFDPAQQEDTTAPTVRITSPGAVRLTFPAMFSGTFSDNVGVTQLYLRIWRYTNGVREFWSPSANAWVTTGPTRFAVTRNTGAGTWTFNGTLPKVIRPSSPLIFYVSIIGQDAAGNSAQKTISFTVADDITGPVVTFSAPYVNNAAFDENNAASALPTLQGTVADDFGVLGVQEVYLRLSRIRGGVREYWNPVRNVWQSTLTRFLSTPERPSRSPSWIFNGLMPTGAKLLDGVYYVTAIAEDASGNRGTSTVRFTLHRSVDPGSTASVQGTATLTAVSSAHKKPCDLYDSLSVSHKARYVAWSPPTGNVILPVILTMTRTVV